MCDTNRHCVASPELEKRMLEDFQKLVDKGVIFIQRFGQEPPKLSFEDFAQ